MIEITPQLTFIYGLKDPRDHRIYYVGKTINREVRLRQHMADTSETPKVRWIMDLKHEGLQPEMVVLEAIEVGCVADVVETEFAWIDHGLANDWPLTNVIVRGSGWFTIEQDLNRSIEYYFGRLFGSKVDTTAIIDKPFPERLELFTRTASQFASGRLEINTIDSVLEWLKTRMGNYDDANSTDYSEQ